MSTPDPSYELVNAQYKFYTSATRLANLWFALTIIWLVLTGLTILVSCVGVILGAGTFITFLNAIMQSMPSY